MADKGKTCVNLAQYIYFRQIKYVWLRSPHRPQFHGPKMLTIFFYDMNRILNSRFKMFSRADVFRNISYFTQRRSLSSKSLAYYEKVSTKEQNWAGFAHV